MKTRRAASGPFLEQPFFSDEEFERTACDELRGVGLLPETPEAVRIDWFIEKRFGVVHEYADLGPGLLGVTIFSSRGVSRIVLATELDADGDRVQARRARATLAHEVGHGLLHAFLFALEGVTKPLFGDFATPSAPRVLCKEEHVARPGALSGYDGRWWEYQANRMMASLLLPKPLVLKATEPFSIADGSLGCRRIPQERRSEAAAALADIFDVNPQVARLRIESLFPVAEDAQLHL